MSAFVSRVESTMDTNTNTGTDVEIKTKKRKCDSQECTVQKKARTAHSADVSDVTRIPQDTPSQLCGIVEEGEGEEEEEEEEEGELPLCTLPLVSEQFVYDSKSKHFRLQSNHAMIRGLTHLLERRFYDHYRPFPRTRSTPFPCSSKKVGELVEKQIAAYCKDGSKAKHRFARHFCEWMRSEKLRCVASQFCIYDAESEIGTPADFIMQHTETHKFILVELKCGYEWKYRNSEYPMRCEMRDVRNSRQNQHFLQLAWMHYVLRTELYPEISFEAVLVVINQRRIRNRKKKDEPLNACVYKLPPAIEKLERTLHESLRYPTQQ